MSTYTSLVTRFVQDCKSRGCNDDSVTVVTSMLSNWEKDFSEHFTGSRNAKRQKREPRVRDPDMPVSYTHLDVYKRQS